MVDKSGKVLASEAGGPAATVEVVRKLVAGGDTAPAPVTAPAAIEPKPEVAPNGVNGATTEDEARAAVADEVADTAEKLDSNESKAIVA